MLLRIAILPFAWRRPVVLVVAARNTIRKNLVLLRDFADYDQQCISALFARLRDADCFPVWSCIFFRFVLSKMATEMRAKN